MTLSAMSGEQVMPSSISEWNAMSLEERVERLADDLRDIRRQIGSVNAGIDGLHAKVAAAFERQDERFSRLEALVSPLEPR